MNIEYRSIDDIKPYENNPRDNSHSVEYVANSIRRFGFRNPIVIDGDGVIVCGHTRYEAAKSIGISEIPCVLAENLTDSQIKAFRLVDNRVSELSEWDYEKLETEMLGIVNIDMGSFGFVNFDSAPIDDLFDDVQKAKNEPSMDDLGKSTKSKDEFVKYVCPCCGESFLLNSKLKAKKC